MESAGDCEQPFIYHNERAMFLCVLQYAHCRKNDLLGEATMAKLKVTVLRMMENRDYADEYCDDPATALPCTDFTVGQEFITHSADIRPEGFCGWAWNDIHKGALTLMNGGNFRWWMKNDNELISCCTDGIRPVVFKLERIDD
jgi:uncharacterized repeat protein (TIGR04076 family)